MDRRQTTHTVTMECAGNGRARLSPRPVSQPWLDEAVGTAALTGTPLAPLLEEAGILDSRVSTFTRISRFASAASWQQPVMRSASRWTFSLTAVKHRLDRIPLAALCTFDELDQLLGGHGLSTTTSQRPSDCSGTTSALRPCCLMGVPSGPVPVSAKSLTTSAVSPASSTCTVSATLVGLIAQQLVEGMAYLVVPASHHTRLRFEHRRRLVTTRRGRRDRRR